MKEQKNIGLVVLVIILIFLVIGLTAFICYDKGLFSKKEEIKQNNNTPKQDVAEKEITDKYIIEDLEEKTMNILTMGQTKLLGNISKDRSINIGNTYGIYIDKLLNLTEKDKLYIILNNEYLNKTNVEPITTSMYESAKKAYKELWQTTNEVPNEMLETLEFINEDYIQESYKKYFNYEPSHISIKSIDASDKDFSCPAYVYDRDSHGYYQTSECGGTAFPGMLIYKDRYTFKEEEAYAYVNLGSISYDYDNDVNSVVYKDLVKNNGNLIYKDNLKYEEANSFKIDKNNNQDFQGYKFIFQKDKEGIYHFKSIEKVD